MRHAPLAAVCAAVAAAGLAAPPPAAAKTRTKDLIAAFNAGKGEDRARLAYALGRSREKKAADALLQALDVKRGNPKESAVLVEALGLSGDERAAGRLSEAWDYLRSVLLQLGELPPHLQALRVSVLEALGRLGGDDAVSILSTALNDKDPRVVEEAVRGLGRLHDRDAVPALQQLGGTAEGAPLRQAVFEALGEIGDKRAISTLEQAQSSADKFVEVESAYALAKLGQKEQILKLQDYLKADPGEEKIGLLAGYYLARLDRNSGLEHLDAELRRPDNPAAPLAADALGKSENPRAVLVLAEAAKAPDEPVRLAVTRGLARLGGPRAVTALRKLRSDPAASVRAAAAGGLIELGELD